MKTILFDVDGVLARFVEGFTGLANTLYGDVPIISTEEMQTWDGFPGMNAERISQTWYALIHDNMFWFNLKPAVSLEVFKRVDTLNRNNIVYFVTSRIGVDCKRQTEVWLERHGIRFPTVIVSHQKAAVSRVLSVSHGIEDQLHNARDINDIGVETYLLDRPYNQAERDSGIQRVQRVEDFLDIMEVHEWKG